MALVRCVTMLSGATRKMLQFLSWVYGATGPVKPYGVRAEAMTWQSDKWPANKTVGFLLLTGAGLWAVLGFAIHALFR
jgi:hypothetical protein